MCEDNAAARFAELRARPFASTTASTGAFWPAPRLKILPLGPVAKTYGERLLAVGDAAGLVKPTTGGGIYYGLVSGLLAADVLNAALREDDLGEARLRAYEELWQEGSDPEIRVGLKFRRLASRLNDGAIDARHRARAHRWPRAAAEADGQFQLARHLRGRAASSRRIPQNPACVDVELSGAALGAAGPFEVPGE